MLPSLSALLKLTETEDLATAKAEGGQRPSHKCMCALLSQILALRIICRHIVATEKK